MSDLFDSGQPKSENQNLSESEKALIEYLTKQNEEHGVLQVRVFQLTLQSLRQNLPVQCKFICSQIVQPFFKLAEAGAATSTCGQNALLKEQSWNRLKDSVLKTLLAQIYTTRVVNLISVVQFLQGGKLYYQQEKAKK